MGRAQCGVTPEDLFKDDFVSNEPVLNRELLERVRANTYTERSDRYQKTPYGTTAWKGSYGRCLQVENCNSILKDKGGLQSRWCRALRLAPRFVAIVMMCVAVGMRVTRPDLDDSRNPVDEELLNDEDETGTDPQQEPPSGLGDSQSEDRSRDGPV